MTSIQHNPVSHHPAVRFGAKPPNDTPATPPESFAFTVSSQQGTDSQAPAKEKPTVGERVVNLFNGIGKQVAGYYRKHVGFESEDKRMDYYMNQAREDILHGKVDRAFRTFTWAENRTPTRVETFLQTGRLLNEMIQYKRFGWLNEANRQAQLKGIEFPELKAGMQHTPLEDLQNEALKAFEKAHSLNTQLAEPMEQLAQLHESRGNLEVAKGFVKQLTQIFPSEPKYYAQLGEFYSRQNNAEKAIHKLKKAIELAPDHDGFHARLGELYLKKGDLKNAETHLLTATQKNDSEPQYFLTLSTVYTGLNQHSDATKASSKAASLLLERERKQNPTKLN